MKSQPGRPVARRLQRPSWRDARLIVGLVLVLLSIVGGARLVASLDDTTSVLVATRPLVPGQEVSADDVEAVDFRLSDGASLYVLASAGVQPGTYALRNVEAGEVIPATALGGGDEVDSRAVTVAVDPATAASLRIGETADIWVSQQDPDALGSGFEEPELLLAGATVAATPESGGALGVGVGDSPVQVVVPADRVGEVIASVDQEARITLVPAPESEQR